MAVFECRLAGLDSLPEREVGVESEHGQAGQANALLFEVIEYVEPRMKSDQAYPPVVRMAVLRAKEKLTNEDAEKKLSAE